ncbi:MAG TPA: fibronectin type III domain-containing protein [Elusimicrobiota bacterium]|nr:fibronectin type III domain-containing protein [Elusimicrobiota bacterium]
MNQRGNGKSFSGLLFEAGKGVFSVFAFAVLAAAFGALPARAGQKMLGSSEDIPRNLVANAGGVSSGGSYSLDSSVGEFGVSTYSYSSSANYSFEPGLENIFAQPGSVTAISTAALSTSTGTLTLNWTAPGFDGEAPTTLESGYYRIDYSSDPAQAALFDPTATTSYAFVVQFPTTTVQGSTQSYTLQNLSPNTTYYARVYLGDETKFFAETSSTASYSTLANLPVSPVLTGVSYTSATFTWSFPAASGTAAGFEVTAASLTAQGYSGPVVNSAMTSNGGTLQLTVNGLLPGGTYYFNLASLNWQGLTNFETVIETVTLPESIQPVTLVSVSSAPLARTITLTWTWFNPTPPNQNGAVVLVSSMVISATDLVNGTAYSPGQKLPDGSVVASTQTGVVSGVLLSTPSFVQAGLTLDTTEYFGIFSENTLNAYSIGVTTSAALDLPPLAPAGLAATINPSASSMTITWAQVKSKTDGTAFPDPSAPDGWEMSGYDVYRSTGLIRPTWVLVSTLPADAVSDKEAMAGPGMVYYYKVVSQDSFPGETTDAAMAVDTQGNLYALDSDNITRIEIPATMAGMVQPNGNSSGEPLLIRAVDQPQDVVASPYIFKSVAFEPYEAPSNEKIANLTLPSNAMFDLALGYKVQNGQIVADGISRAVPLSESNAPVGLFWYNGQQNVNADGTVDTVNQEVTGQVGMLGDFRLQSYVAPAQASFDPSSDMSTKVITPTVASCSWRSNSSEHGCDDHVEFNFGNPQDLNYSGEVFDVRGFHVADMGETGCSNGGGPGTFNVCLTWDGRGSNGEIVARGVYIYEIKVGGETWTGTVVVIR